MSKKSEKVKNMSLTKEAVKAKMKESNVIVLNVLTEADYAKLHIEGSENLPLEPNADGFAQSVEKKYGKDKFFITYCASVTCHAGPNAAKALQVNGFKADDYPGGMKEWLEAGFPTEGTETKIPAMGQAVEPMVSK